MPADKANNNNQADLNPEKVSDHLTEMLSTSPANTSFILPSMDGSPPKVVTMEEVKHVFKNLQNMTLAHEIALNPEFKLQPYEPPPNSLERRVKDMVHKAFWDLLREQLSHDPPCYDYAIQLLADIKEFFPQILTLNNRRTLEFINEVLDDAVIRQQAERGVLDFRTYANFVIQIMAKSCAPARDEVVQNLTKITDVVDTFRGILETMTLMKLDMANYLLDLSRNDIMNHSVEYEKEKFKEYLEYYKMGFPSTENWLKRNRTFDDKNVPCSDMEAIYNAYMELVDWPQSDEFPEVLSMDKDRILQLGVRGKRLALVASIMSVAQALPIISQRSENRAELANQVMILLQDIKLNDEALPDIMQSNYVYIKKFVNEALEKEKTPPMSESVDTQLKQQLIQLSNKASPVRVLMWKRLTTLVRFTLLKPTLVLPTEVPGFMDYYAELQSFVANYRVIISYNHSVFGDYFLELLNKKHEPTEQPMKAAEKSDGGDQPTSSKDAVKDNVGAAAATATAKTGTDTDADTKLTTTTTNKPTEVED